jgi:hypothetical protein
MEKKATSTARIDERVFFTMGLIAFVCLFILGFKIKNYESCKPVAIRVNPSVTYEGSTVSFKAETQGGKRYEWDFGDSSSSEYSGAGVTHNYPQAGRYTVMVTVNGNCYAVAKVDIRKAPVIINNSHKPMFSGPLTAELFKQVTFRDSTPGATRWEWNFGENGIDAVDATGQIATYSYKTPGYKDIYLRINGNPNRIGTWQIYVNDIRPDPVETDRPATGKRIPRGAGIGNIQKDPTVPPLTLPDGGSTTPPPLPTPPVPEVVKVPDIKPDEMGAFLKEVVSGKKTAADFYKYFCGGQDILVKYNDKSMTFNQMCKELRDFKKANKIEDPQVTVQTDKGTNCIRGMKVTVNRKKLMDRIF